MLRKFLLGACVAMVFAVGAGDLKTVEATYLYHAPMEMSVQEARQKALDRAMAKALAQQFGMVVTQSTATAISDKDGDVATTITAVGQSEVRGEWIETIGEPIYDISFNDGLITVAVSVKGKAREIDFSLPQFEAVTLRNGVDASSAATDFIDGDALYMGFESPVQGYVAAYLVDDMGDCAYRILPYVLAPNEPMEVCGETRHLFFHRDAATDPALTDEVEMTCGNSNLELNDLCILFSTEKFLLPIAVNGNEYEVRSLKAKDFRRWLASTRSKNKKLQSKTIHITIKNKAQ